MKDGAKNTNIANFNHQVSTRNSIATQQTFLNIINMETNVNIVTHVVIFDHWQTLADTNDDQYLSNGNCRITLKWQCSHSPSAYTRQSNYDFGIFNRIPLLIQLPNFDIYIAREIAII